MKFTQQQIDFICYTIGDWYLTWKPILVDYENKTHRLGYAKERLKELLCMTNDEHRELVIKDEKVTELL